MSCDICGEAIYGKSSKVVVEGAILEVCGRCAHLGKPYVPPARVSAYRPQRVVGRTSLSKPSPPRVSSTLSRTYEDLDLVEGFGEKIRTARERIGLTQAELAAKVKERLSIVQKIEIEKMTPPINLCMAFEHVLKIALLTPRTEAPMTTLIAAKAEEVTLGDVVKMKQKN